MSNWLKAKIVDVLKNPRKDLLEQACDDMGYTINWAKKVVHGAYSFEAAQKVDCVLMHKNTQQESTIGFQLEKVNGETLLHVTGDFYNTKFSGEEFMKRLGLRYNRHMIVNALEFQGYTVEEETDEGTEVKITCYRAAA